MESENNIDLNEDNQHGSRQSLRSRKIDSRASSSQNYKNKSQDKIQDEGEKETNVESRSKTRTWRSDPDRDRVSDEEGQRSSESYYSDDYEKESASERSLSPFSRSLSPSPSPHKGVERKRISGSPMHKIGRKGLSRPHRLGRQPLTQQHRRGLRSQGSECTPPKDLDLVTKRMLSARLLKINELRNALSELQQRTDELQKENRVLRQLQVRQEKVLQRYNDTESEISQLISRHSNETHVLRERLRRTQERERAAERRLKDSEEQLHRSQATVVRLKKLVDQRDLGARDELSRRLEDEKTRAQEGERKIKELERSMELSTGSYQRQLATERKKTISAQEEIRNLQEELERLRNKLKEKERELDAMNIYANRIVKPSQRTDTESGAKRKVASRSSCKAVQTEDRSSSLDFPSPPPPAITDNGNDRGQEPDEYLSLKELGRGDRQAETRDGHQRMRGDEKGKDREMGREERQRLNQEMVKNDEKANGLQNASVALDGEREPVEDNRTKSSSLLSQSENNKKRGHVQEEVDKWNQEALANQEAAEETRQKKEQLLARLREIDRQNQGGRDTVFEESKRSSGDHLYPHPPEHRNHNNSIFSLTEPEESASDGGRAVGRRADGVESGAAATGMGRRAVRAQVSTDDLAFGSYAPSFGFSSRGSSGFPPPPPREDRESALEAIGVFSLRGVETDKDKDFDKGGGKDRKSSLMQQLFGSLATPTGESVASSSKTEAVSTPPTSNGVHSRRDRLRGFNSGSSTPPVSSVNILHVADSRPAIRAIPSFDDDIEELTL